MGKGQLEMKVNITIQLDKDGRYEQVRVFAEEGVQVTISVEKYSPTFSMSAGYIDPQEFAEMCKSSSG